MFKNAGMFFTTLAVAFYSTHGFAIAPGAGQAQIQNSVRAAQQNQQQMQQMKQQQQMRQQQQLQKQQQMLQQQKNAE